MFPSFLDRNLIPHKPGVYIYKDKNKQVIYVGKAIDLYHRVASYFAKVHEVPKTNVLVAEIAGIETVVVESELEALILEANLIKKYLPKFNVRLMDDKDYLYSGIRNEASPRSAGGAGFPKVITLRRQDLKKVKKYFGPFPSSTTVKDTLKRLRRVFPWCNGWRGKQRACFYQHIGLCPGPCVGLINKQDYNKIINRFSKFLDGKKEELVNELMEEMQKASDGLDYEEAGRVKKIIEGINYLTQTNRTQLYLENPNFLEQENLKAIEELQKVLGLPKLPERIEGYDISNISGKDATGSMVVLTNGEIDKSQYRKFKIKIAGRPNDVGMHKEMMRRRLKNDWPLPDLIIVDGGRGQVNGVYQELQAKNLEIPIFGLAKRMEWLYPPGEISAPLSNSRDAQIVKLPRKSLSLKALQKLRDESHRFAITYHRKLHQKSMLVV